MRATAATMAAAGATWGTSGNGQPSSTARGVSAEALAIAAARRTFLASAAAAVESFFLEPAGPAVESESATPLDRRPVVCVFGLARNCGVTVVARALAAELALRDSSGTAAVACDARPGGIPLATPAAARLARTLADVPGATPRAVGRLCLVGGAEPLRLSDTARHHAPLVIDAGSEALGGAPASVADCSVIVTRQGVEPALARVAAECVARVGPPPIVVLNRAPHDQPRLFALPNSPMGARLALGGREARGALGRAIADLADLCEEFPSPR
jgi:hypothetical protein